MPLSFHFGVKRDILMASYLLFLIMPTSCDHSFNATGGGGAAPGDSNPGDESSPGPSFGQRPEESSRNEGISSSVDGSGGAGGIDSSRSSLCSGGEVNVILIFDNSGSQSSQDLSSMRSGATNLISELTNLATQTDSPFVPYVATVRFSDTATIGSNRWVNLKTNSASATADVNEATANDGGNTHYSQALSKAGDLLREKKATFSQKNQRNFVVFLSDGEPDDRDSVKSAAQGIADQAAVAFITIGTGGRKFAILKEMASITSANYPQNHRGQFLEASGQTAVASTFRQVGDTLKSLCTTVQ